MYYERHTGGEGASTMSERLGMQQATPSVSEQGIEMVQDPTRNSYNKRWGPQLSRKPAGPAGTHSVPWNAEVTR